MNERDTDGVGGGGVDGDGFDGDAITANETTDVVDFASMWTTRVGRSICQCAARAGRIGDGIVELGRDVAGLGKPGMRTIKSIAADARCEEAIGAFQEIIRHLGDARNFLQGQAALSHANEEP